jgi:hypothetical protein
MDQLIDTCDPFVKIEEQREGYVRYRRTTDGRRWEVWGVCDQRGDCLIGAVFAGEVIRDHAHLDEIKRRTGLERIGPDLDVPETPEYDVCCGADIFRYVELERAAA